jgi:fatty-acyl-CoA synthase
LTSTIVSENLEKTPRWTAGMNQIHGEFETLTEGLDYAAFGDTGFNFYAPRGALAHVLPYRELREKARETGSKLISAGLKYGERVAIVAETGPDFVITFFACQYAGLVPCPVPYAMNIGGKDAYVTRIAGMLCAADAAAIVTPESLKENVGEAASRTDVRLVLTHDTLQKLPADGELKPFGKDDVAYIQYSSGSTSAPKGVLITQKAIVANTRAMLRDGLQITPDDRAFSWLPLYHDMGLVGFCLGPMMGQVTVDYLATPAFARRPALWLTLMSDNRSTVCYAPSFGFDLASRRVNGSADKLDLSSWRVAGIGGDMVRADVLNEFTDRLGVAGFDAKAFLPSYGMAEFTLAVTFAPLDSEIRIDVVDRAKMKETGRAEPANEIDRMNKPERVRSFVACGTVVPEHELVVRDGKGNILGDREIGHVMVKGPSLMSGYYNNLDATAEIMGEDGFMDTGDMGYLLDGQIVLTGRAKDLILHNGRNIWPQDIEWAAEQLDDLRSGDVAAFGIEDEDGEEHVTVLVHCRFADEARREALRSNVNKIVHQSAGVECNIVLIPPRSLPFTSSGKLSRAGAKSKFASGEIVPVEEAGPKLVAVG